MFKVLAGAVTLAVAAAALLPKPKAAAEAAEKAASAAAAPAEDPPGVAVKNELEALESAIQAGLEELRAATADFAAERRKWTSLDRSVAGARAVNRALLARSRAVVGLYETRLEGPIGQYRERLKAAPAVYRKMAEERRGLLATATLELERRNYLAMAETCEAADVLCERRFEEYFTEPAPGGEDDRPNAASLGRTVANMKKLQLVHEKWEETFAAYPTSLDTPGLSAWFDALALYAEDLDAFTRSVEELKAAMKQKASEEREPAGKR
jgi:hypothetical protein